MGNKSEQSHQIQFLNKNVKKFNRSLSKRDFCREKLKDKNLATTSTKKDFGQK